jgi:hypothetical protein
MCGGSQAYVQVVMLLLLLLLLLLMLMLHMQFTSFVRCDAAAVTQADCSSLALVHSGCSDTKRVVAVCCSGRCKLFERI